MEAVRTGIELARRLAENAEGMTIDEVATEFGVNRRTAERWIDVIRGVFPDVDVVRDGRKYRFRIPRGLDRMTVSITAEELAELGQAAGRLKLEGALDRASQLSSLSRKLRAAQHSQKTARLDTDVEALMTAETLAASPGPRARYSSGHLQTIRKAILMGRTVRMVYGRNGKVEERAVDPYGILFGRSYFLVGPVVGKSSPVQWRLDRIESIEIDERLSQRPADFDLQAYAAQSVGIFKEPPEPISLLFSAEVGPDVGRIVFHPDQRMESLEDGSVRVSFTAGGFRELAWHLVTWGRAVTVESPAVLDDLLDEIVWETMMRPRVPERGHDVTMEVIQGEWTGDHDDRRDDEAGSIPPPPP